MTCVDCHREVNRLARGLCPACYYRHSRDGDLDRFDAARSASVLIEEYIFFSEYGLSLEEIAARLGVKPASLKTALGRHARTQAGSS